MTPAFGRTEGFEQFLLTNEIIFLVMAGDTGITDSRHILRAEPEDFAHVVVAHAALRRSGTSSPESSHSAGVWTLMPSNSAAFPIFTRGMSTAVTPIFR